MNGHKTTAYAIYEHPPEFPDHVVVWPWCIGQAGTYRQRIGCLVATIEEARRNLPRDLRCYPREDYDGPHLVEFWI